MTKNSDKITKLTNNNDKQTKIKNIYFYALLFKLIFNGWKQAVTQQNYLWFMHRWIE